MCFLYLYVCLVVKHSFSLLSLLPLNGRKEGTKDFRARMSGVFVIDGSGSQPGSTASPATLPADASSASAEHQLPEGQPEEVEDLIPLCATHPSGPQQTTSTFGYDIAEMKQRPWAQPGAKLSDYFNYGFNEQSWRLYCRLQSEGRESLLQKAKDVIQELQLSATVNPGGEGGAGGYGGGEGRYPGSHYPYQGGGGESGYGRRPDMPHHAQDRRPPAHHVRYKTQLCVRFSEGRCAHGASCNYAHGEGELRRMGGGGPPNSGPGPDYGDFRGQKRHRMDGYDA